MVPVAIFARSPVISNKRGIQIEVRCRKAIWERPEDRYQDVEYTYLQHIVCVHALRAFFGPSRRQCDVKGPAKQERINQDSPEYFVRADRDQRDVSTRSYVGIQNGEWSAKGCGILQVATMVPQVLPLHSTTRTRNAYMRSSSVGVACMCRVEIYRDRDRDRDRDRHRYRYRGITVAGIPPSTVILSTNGHIKARIKAPARTVLSIVCSDGLRRSPTRRD